MTQEMRRDQILTAARGCFAQHGFAGTTTKALAQAASVSEGLLFKYFPSKAALYAEILVEECQAYPDFARLMSQPPSTNTLFELTVEMVRHHCSVAANQDLPESQRFRLMVTSQLKDGSFARLMEEKINDVFGRRVADALVAARAAGDAIDDDIDPMNHFWFAHQVAAMMSVRCLSSSPESIYRNAANLERQVLEFILRGFGLKHAVIASLLEKAPTPVQLQPALTESA